jgi:hypothetical protein
MSWILIHRMLQGLGTVVMLYVASHWLSGSAQGAFYVLTSLVALQIFVELGFSQTLVQVVSHEMAHIRWESNRKLDGPVDQLFRLGAVMRVVGVWCAVAAIAVVVLIWPIGNYIIDSGDAGDHSSMMRATWLGVCLFMPLALSTTIVLAFFEGCNRLSEVYAVRALQAIMIYGLTALLIWLGHGVSALLWGYACSAIVGACVVAVLFGPASKSLIKMPLGIKKFNWVHEVWPFQWRMSVSFLSGYFMSSALTPIAYAHSGLIEAGQVGLTMQIVLASGYIASAWMSAAAPSMGAAAGARAWTEFDSVYKVAVKRATISTAVLLVTVCAGALYIHQQNLELSKKLLEPGLVSLMAIAALCNQIASCQAAYLRAHRIEPFLWISIIHGVSATSLALFFARIVGANGVIWGYVISSLSIGLFAATFVFVKYRRLLLQNR